MYHVIGPLGLSAWDVPCFVMRYLYTVLSSFQIFIYKGLLLTFCLLLLPLLEFVIVLCFVLHYFMSILVLQSF